MTQHQDKGELKFVRIGPATGHRQGQMQPQPGHGSCEGHGHDHAAHGPDHGSHKHDQGSAKHGHSHGHHDHSHGHHDHTHGVTDERRIAWAFFIIAAFVVVEVVGALFAGSLALLADAGHMLSDAAALGFSLMALRAGRRPASATMTYGYRRLEILAAFVNGCMLFAISAWIIIAAIGRLLTPVSVHGGTMLWVAFAGLAANVAAFLVLHGGDKENLNMRSAWLHVLSDVLGFIGAIVAAVIIIYTGWSVLDPILSVAVALLILRSAWGIVRSSAHILIEGTPSGLNLEDIRVDLIEHVAGVTDVHHIHAWSIAADQTLLTLHVRHEQDAVLENVVREVKVRLAERFTIEHVTIQPESGPCLDAALHHSESSCHD